MQENQILYALTPLSLSLLTWMTFLMGVLFIILGSFQAATAILSNHPIKSWMPALFTGCLCLAVSAALVWGIRDDLFSKFFCKNGKFLNAAIKPRNAERELDRTWGAKIWAGIRHTQS